MKPGFVTAVVICILIILVAPFIAGPYFTRVLVKVLIFALFAMSLDLILGYTGLASLGHAVYFGFSAYSVALLAQAGITDTITQMIVGPLSAAMLALVFGPLSLRVRGAYHFMITLALSQVVWAIAFGWRSVTGGDDGLAGIPQPAMLLGSVMDQFKAFYYLVLIICSSAAFVLWIVVISPFGKVLVGIRENGLRMSVLGYDTWAYQLAAIVIAAVMAGIAGALFAYSNGFVGTSYLSVSLSAEVLLMVILGGAGTLFGPAAGAAIIVLLQTVISAATDRWMLILGAIYILVVIIAPNGLFRLLTPAR